MTLDVSPDLVILASGAGRDKALARYEAKAGTRLMPDSHNAAKQTGSTLESALDGFSGAARAGADGTGESAVAGLNLIARQRT